MSDNFTNNAEKNRFELKQDGSMATADYRVEGTTLFIDYVESPEELRGTGAAGKLMQHIVDFASKNNLEIKPICGYAASWLTKHKN